MDQAKMAQKPVNCKLANGGVLAAMMVVAIHTAGRELSDIDAGTTLWWLEALGHYSVLVLLFIASLVLGIRLVSPNPHKIDLFFSKFMNLQGLFYFSFGIWIRKRLESGVIATMLKSKRWGFPLAVWSIAVGLIIVMLATIFCYYTGHNLVQAARILFVPPLLLAFVHFVPEQPFPALFNSSAFPVFVMHTLVWKTLGIVLPLRVNSVCGWLLKWAIGFFISVAAAGLLHRFAPRTAKLVFGGR